MFRAGWLLLIAAGVVATLPSGVAAKTIAPLPASDYGMRHVCPRATHDRVSCLALELVPHTKAAVRRTHPIGMTIAGADAKVCEPPHASEGCYGLRPEDLKNVYFHGESATTATPQTIALVDAYNDLNAEQDLAAYSAEFGVPVLPACKLRKEQDCFEKVNQAGESTKLPFPESATAYEQEQKVCKERPEGSETTKEWEAKELACELVEEAEGWSLETSLDIEMAHAVCQNCKILLVEASAPSDEDLAVAEETAVSRADEISNSWGGGEPIAEKRPPSQRALEEEEELEARAIRNAFEGNAQKVITASAGDEGYLNWAEAEEAKVAREPYYVGADFPASSPNVVAVGGTELTLNGSGWQSEAVWNEDHDLEEPNYGAGGSGCSELFEAQPWQQGVPDWAQVGCGSKRAVADISADADPYTGVAVYDFSTLCEYEYEELGQPHIVRSNWCTVGGTSVASPIIASMFALAGGSHDVAYPAKTLYEHLETGLLHRVASGGNGECDDNYASGCSGSMAPSSPRFAFDCGEGVLICNTGPGCAGSYYDGPAGVGTPNGIAALEPGGSAVKDAPECRKEESKGSESLNVTPPPPVELKPPAEEQAKTVHAVKYERAKPRALALTRRARAALSLRGPLARQVAFTFELGAAARAHVTLAIQVGSGKHRRWRKLPYSVVFSAHKGVNAHSLASRQRLAKGRYRLMVSLQGGGASSIAFKVG